MEKTQLVVFNKSDIKEILDQFGFKIHTKKVGQKNRKFVSADSNQPILCPTCERQIPVNRIGTIAHGSRMIFCDNPLCFSTWIVKNKIK
jgi:hypothetical protein